MTEKVKRYSYGYHDDGFGGRHLGLIEKASGDLVLHDDYARLEQECFRLDNGCAKLHRLYSLELDKNEAIEAERDAALKQVEGLRELLADWNAHFTGPKVFGGPLSSLRERTETTLSAKP